MIIDKSTFARKYTQYQYIKENVVVNKWLCEKTGAVLPDADIQIAATALNHGLELVTGNLRHFSRIAGLKLNTILAD